MSLYQKDLSLTVQGISYDLHVYSDPILRMPIFITVRTAVSEGVVRLDPPSRMPSFLMWEQLEKSEAVNLAVAQLRDSGLIAAVLGHDGLNPFVIQLE